MFAKKMRLRAIAMKVALIGVLSALSSSCAMRFKCDSAASSIALDKPAGQIKGSQPQRVSAYLPSDARKSGFEITRVDSIQEMAACGNPLIVTALTLGVVPSSIPIRFDVTVSGKHRGVSQQRQYWVAMTGHYSIWHSLIPPSSDDRAIARGLLDAVDRNQQSPELRLSSVPN
jgi:hypothetical protein